MAQELPPAVMAEVTGVELVPPGVEGMPTGIETIRGFAGGMLRKIIRARFRQSDPEIDLTPDQIAELRQLPKVQLLAAELKAANDTLVNWHRPPALPPNAEGAETPRGAVQARAIQRQVEHSQQAPLKVYDPRSPYKDGLLTVAPSGIGKTFLQAILINYAGIGSPVSEVIPQRRTAVGIVHSNLLINQMLDPDETFQRFVNIGGRTVRVGAYDKDHKQGHDEYDYLLTTPESYVKAIERGAIDLDTTIRFVLDEAHRTALAPGMQHHVDAFGPGLYMYTATPAIARGGRDLRRRFPHLQVGSMREYVQDGILSPMQLFTYRAGPETHAATEIAIRQAVDLLESGRKTLVVCQRGEHMKQAREIAAYINHLYDTGRIELHSRFNNMKRDEIACVIGKAAVGSLKSEENISFFRGGERLLATTVATGNEGLNIVDLDGLVVIGPQGAQWMIDQWVGRIGRPSGRLAVAVEIFPHNLMEGRPLASIFRTFDMEDQGINAGYYIGPTPEGKDTAADRIGRLTLGKITASKGEDTDTPKQRSYVPPPTELYTPPFELRDVLLTNVSIREATIAPADLAKLPPPDYKPLDAKLFPGVPIDFLYGILSKQDDPAIRYVIKWEEDADGNMHYVRYYSPAAHQYFEKNPIPEIASGVEFSRQDMADVLGVSYSFIVRTIRRLRLQPLPNRMTASHHRAYIYDVYDFAKVAAEIEKVPMADITDIPIREIQAELGARGTPEHVARYNIEGVDKRRHPFWGIPGICMHISEAQAYFLREVSASLTQADPILHISYAEIVERADLTPKSLAVAIERLPEDKQPIFGWMASGPNRGIRFVDREWGEAFIEYVKPERVLPWEVTRSMLADYFGCNFRTVESRLKGVELKRIPLPGVAGFIPVYPMSAIPLLVSKGFRPDNAPLVNAKLAALSPEDMGNEKRIAYSQRVQRLFLPPEYMPPPEKVPYYYERRKKPPILPDPVPPKEPLHRATLIVPPKFEKRPALPAKPPQSSFPPAPPFSAPTSPPAKRPKPSTPPPAPFMPSTPAVAPLRPSARGAKPPKLPTPPPTIEVSENLVNLQQYLEEQGVACAPNLLLLLARKHHIDSKKWQYTNRGVFTSENDASTIALAIMEYDIAPLDIGDPMVDQVAVSHITAQYSGKAHLSDGDVHKLAARILQHRSLAMEDFVTPLRYRLPDGTAGPLVMHYNTWLANEVRKELDILSIRRRLPDIRRW